MKTCPDCGLEEIRTRDAFGNDTTNLSPLSGQCVRCLIRANRAKAREWPTTEPTRDPKALAARNDA